MNHSGINAGSSPSDDGQSNLNAPLHSNELAGLLNRPDTVVLPRWIVYLQGGLLGVVAATFFLFGLMVGHLTSAKVVRVDVVDCEVSGSVNYFDDGELKPDRGAVVVIIPRNKTPMQRSDGRMLHPDSFEPLNNEGIDIIHQLGGAVSRVDERGRFQVIVDSPGKYQVLVVSKHNERRDSKLLSKKQMAAIGSYFIPVDDLIGQKDFHWDEFSSRDKPFELPEVEFE